MGAIGRFFSGLVSKANPANKVILQLGLSQGPQWTNHTYSQLAKAGYLVNTDVYSCVNHISRAIKGIEWQVFDGPKKENLITDSPLIDLLRNPNPLMGTAEFKENMVGFMMLAGNNFTYRAMGGNRAMELWPLRSDRMNVIQGNWRNPVAGYVYKVGFSEQEFKPDGFGQTVLHTKLFNPVDDWRGLSPLQNAARTVDQSNDIQSWNVCLMQNAATPNGGFFTDDELSPDQKVDLRREIEERLAGPANARRPIVVDGGMTWQQMGLKPTDLDWLSGDEHCTRKICSVYGVPPELLGVMSKGGLNDANFTQARQKFYMETVLPLLDHLLDDLNRWLYPIFNQWIGYDKDDIEAIQAGREILYTRARTNIQQSLMSIDEARHVVGLPPLPDGMGKAVLIPSQCRILGQDAPQPNPNQPRAPGDEGKITPAGKKFQDSIEMFLQLEPGEYTETIQ